MKKLHIQILNILQNWNEFSNEEVKINYKNNSFLISIENDSISLYDCSDIEVDELGVFSNFSTSKLSWFVQEIAQTIEITIQCE